MATVTARGIVWTTTTGAKTVASFTPGAGDLIVCVAGVAGTDTAPTISDNDSGITSWTLVDSFRSYGSAVTGGLRIYVAGQACSGSPMTVTMTPGAADTGGGLAVFSVTSPSAYGASAVRSSGGQADIASGTPAPVLSNTPLSKNPVIVAVMTNTNGSANASPRSSPAYSEAYDQGFNTPPSGLEVQFVNSSETSATLTTGGAAASAFAAIGIEVATNAAFAQPVNDTMAGTDGQAKVAISTTADAATVTDAVDPQLSAGAFSPDSIAGLECWLKADAIGLADGAAVATWEDSHTSNKDAAQATSGSQPTYQTTEQNGLPGVLFDGIDDQLTVAGVTNNDATRTLFIMARASTATANRRVLGWNNSAGIAMSATEWTYRDNEAVTAVTLGGTPTTATLIAIRYNGTTSADAYRDLGSATNFNPNDAYQGLSTALGIGSRNAGQFWPGYVFEVLVYDSALADTDLDDVRGYLSDKWLGAAAGHEQPVDDAIAGTDAQAKAAAHPVADTAASTDAQAKRVTASKADTIAGTDAATRRVTGTKAADAAAATDAQTKTWTAVRSQPDAIAGTDAQAKASTHPLTDAAAATDARAASVGRALADSVAGTDAAARRVGSARADAIAGTDARTSASAKALADQVAGTDARARVWTAKLTVSDGLSVTDSVSTSAAGANERNVNDTIAGTDALSRSFQAKRTVSDSAAGTDARTASVGHPLADAIAGTDARTRVWAAKRTIADGISATDAANIGAAGAREQDVDDSAIVTDAVSISLGSRRTLGDSATVTDASATQADYVRQPADVLAVADVLTRAWAIFEEQADGVTVTDAVDAGIPPARWPPATDEDWPDSTDEDWEAQTDDRWLVSAESRW